MRSYKVARAKPEPVRGRCGRLKRGQNFLPSEKFPFGIKPLRDFSFCFAHHPSPLLLSLPPSPSREPGAHRVSGRAAVPVGPRYGRAAWVMSPHIRALGWPRSRREKRGGRGAISERRVSGCAVPHLARGSGGAAGKNLHAQPGQEHRTGGREVARIYLDERAHGRPSSQPGSRQRSWRKRPARSEGSSRKALKGSPSGAGFFDNGQTAIAGRGDE